ncbi:hypothetical protein BDR06DRAFT_974985 [Suillus hirtellus]|nr:hypothetical protein BDR06DRAFT_974985 [Suillus hirtellus]
MSPNPTLVTGRVLATPKIHYGNPASSRPVQPRNGSWNGIDQTFHKLRSLGLLNYSRMYDTDGNLDEASDFKCCVTRSLSTVFSSSSNCIHLMVLGQAFGDVSQNAVGYFNSTIESNPPVKLDRTNNLSYSPVIPVPSCHLTYKMVEGTGLIHCPLQEERGAEMEIYSDLSLDETYLGILQETDRMDVVIDLDEADPGMLRELERMDVDISLDDTDVGTYTMDVDANVDADIDMDEFYLENVENREAMQVNAHSDQMDID